MIQAVESYVEQGRCGTGNAVLGSNTKVLPVDDAVIDALKSKHPQGENDPFQRYEGFVPGSMPHSGLAQFLLQKKMSADTSPGVSGWTYDLTMLAFQVPAFTTFFNLLLKQVIQNNAPGKTMLCASKLIPLSKPDNGVRPIAVGEIFYRLMMKTIMNTYFNIGCLLPNQLGVGSKGGVEPIIYAAQREVDRDGGSQFSHLISLDFSNAFNTLKRSSLCSSVFKHLQPIFRCVKWAYNQPAPLVLNDGDNIVSISSSQGVRQGDPLGPLLFSLGVKEILQKLQTQLQGRAIIMAYLDDVYLFAKEDVMDEVDEFFRNTTVGLKLNRSKCSVWKVDDVKASGCSMLGSFVGSKEKRVDFLREKIDKVVSKLNLLQGLRSQHALLLLTRCIQMELRHLQRGLRTDDILEEWSALDTALIRQVQLLRGSPREQLLDEWIISLPARFGGLGISMHKQIAPLAYSAMEDFTQGMLRPIFDTVYEPSDDNEVQPEMQRQRVAKLYEEQYKKHADLTRDQQNILLDSQSKFGKSWLTTIPYNKSLALSNAEISVALHYRTLCPGQAEYCLACGLRNSLGHDDLCQSRPNLRRARHEHIKRLLLKHLQSVPNNSITSEPTTKNSHRRTDFRIGGSCSMVGGASEYDLTIIAPTADYKGSRGEIQRYTTAEGRYKKELVFYEHEKELKYRGITHTPFYPLVFSAGGTLTDKSKELFLHWKKHIKYFGTLVRHISVGLVRARAAFFTF